MIHVLTTLVSGLACAPAAPAALATHSAAVAARPAAPAQDAPGSLADFFDEADAYLELDLGLLGEQVRRTRVGRALREVEPLQGVVFGASTGEASVTLHPLEGLAQGVDLWETLVRQLVARLGPETLALAPEQVDRIAAAGGQRVTYLFRAGEPWEDTPAAWAMGWSLRPAGSEALAAELMPALARLASGSERYTLAPEIEGDAQPAGAEDVRAYRLEGPGVGTTWLVLREDLLAWTADAELGAALRRPARPAPGARSAPATTAFHRARRAALDGGYGAWLWAHAPALARRLAFDDGEARALLCALGLDDVGDVTLGVGARGGSLVSQLELRRGGRSGLHGLVRGAPCAWRSLEALTADALVVLGMPRSPRDVLHQATELALWIDSDLYRDLRVHWRAMERVPVLGGVLEPGALGEELVLFARPTLSPRPHVYLAAPLGPALADELARREAEADAAGGALHLEGGGAVVERVVRGSVSFWVARHDSFDHVAWARVGDHLVLTEDARAMQAYLGARQRERLADREQAVAAVWAGLHASFAGRGDDGAFEHTGLFLHSRSGRVVERLWPLALLALRMELGEAADVLPTPAELADAVGESTVVLIDRPDRLEWRGHGFLAGLALLF